MQSNQPTEPTEPTEPAPRPILAASVSQPTPMGMLRQQSEMGPLSRPGLERQETGLLPQPGLERQHAGTIPAPMKCQQPETAALMPPSSGVSCTVEACTGFGGPEAEPIDPQDGSWTALVHRSDVFGVSIPTSTAHNLLRAITGDEAARKRATVMAAGVRPVITLSVQNLMNNWLDAKRVCGSRPERILYTSTVEGGGGCDTVPALVDRLLLNRFVALVGPNDKWMTASGLCGEGGVDAVGTKHERDGLLKLEENLSYDELALSAHLGLSCPTHFINTGGRGNKGVPGTPDSFEKEGVYVGLVGARFERPGRMEWAHMIVSPEQNTVANGYGVSGENSLGFGLGAKQLLRVWAHFYGVSHLPTYVEAEADTSGRFHKLPSGELLDLLVYTKRIRISAGTLLCEAQKRGEEAGNPAFVHAVGLGLGVWQVDGPVQTTASLHAYRAALEARDTWPYVNHLNFSWFGDAATNGVFGDGEVVNGVTVRFSQRNPAAPLLEEPGVVGKHLLVAAYAWDGGALPGNEYWWGQLDASGDPAAACCSWIGELGNPHINPAVSARNLRVFDTTATQDFVIGVAVTEEEREAVRAAAAAAAMATC